MRTNDDIQVPRVRLVDEDGQQIGIVTIEDALGRAEGVQLDLVEVAPNVTPPVCKIMDYGKFRYQQKKKQSEARKKQKQVSVKEIKLRPSTGVGDYEIKLRKLRKFLADGDRVKVSIWFRGREIVHKDIGFAMLERVEADVGDAAIVEQRARMEGRQMVIMLVPGKGTGNKQAESNHEREERSVNDVTIDVTEDNIQAQSDDTQSK